MTAKIPLGSPGGIAPAFIRADLAFSSTLENCNKIEWQANKACGAAAGAKPVQGPRARTLRFFQKRLKKKASMSPFALILNASLITLFFLQL